jgi:hypothetical protein
MTEPREEESSWDSLADDLGLPPISESKSKAVAPREQPPESPKMSVVEVVVPPSRDTSVLVESPGHVTVSVTVHADPSPAETPVVEIVDTRTNSDDVPTAEVLDEEGDDEEETADGEAPRGKKRRRRRRRGRRGNENAEAAEGGATEAAREAEVIVDELAPTQTETEVEVEDAPEMNEETEETAEPLSAVDEEMEAEVTQPKPEWNVVSWVDLVATLHRPER